MPLISLQIGQTKITDFSPIREVLSLDRLRMLYCRTDDLSFLEGANLSFFAFTFSRHTKGIEFLKRMPRLQRIATTEYDSFTTEEFWRRFQLGLPLDEQRTYYSKLSAQI